MSLQLDTILNALPPYSRKYVLSTFLTGGTSTGLCVLERSSHWKYGNKEMNCACWNVDLIGGIDTREETVCTRVQIKLVV